ncbi:helix-turn-helix transcriptional regulator [Nocardia sp. KC 131]|uniref:helix-turn-helix transcriptional regulator n=1 Tax=Nocardia arseniciresistens TaxID=3392119 RepID=UPI00398F4CEB
MRSPGEFIRPLVGRVDEMRKLNDALDVAQQGGTAVVAVTGEPGIGKTRLVQEVSREAITRGVQVLDGRGTELEREIPYTVLIDALDEPLGLLSRMEMTALGAETLSELGGVLPSLHQHAVSPLAPPVRIERHRLHRSVRVALQKLAARRPLLLVLDDVHWADHASFEVIAHLLRNPVQRCVVLLAHRSGQLPSMHATTLFRAAYENTVMSLELGPLSLRETVELLTGDGDETELADLHRECGGNPFYLQELSRVRIRADHRPGSPESGADTASRVPAIIQAALEQEVRALSPSACTLLQAAAVVGEPFDLDLAAEIADLNEADVGRVTDELMETGLVHDSGIPGRLAFRHPLIRRAVYERSGYGWRRQAHQRAAEALANRGSTLTLRAHHLERSSTVGDEAAVAVLTDAGTVVAPRAPVAAARWFRAALRLLPTGASAERRMALMTALAEALNASGRLRESREVVGDALELVSPAAPADRARMMAMLAVTEQGLGNAAEGRRLLTSALALAVPDSVGAAALKLELVKNHLMMRDWAGALVVASEIRESVRTLDDPRLYFLSTAAAAYLGINQSGDVLLRGQVDLDEAVKSLDSLADSDVAPTLLNGLTDVVLAETCLERWKETVEHADRGIRLCHTTGHSRPLVELAHLKALAFLLQGQLERALAAADDAVEAALLLDDLPMVAMTGASRAWSLSLLGRTGEALVAGAESVRTGAQVPTGMNSWHAPLVYGGLLIEAGQYRRGRQQIVQLGGYAGDYLDMINVTSMPHFLRPLVDAELALGRIDAAEKVSRQIEDIAEAAPILHMRIGDAHYARARVLLARNDAHAALASAEQSVAEYRISGTVVEAARAQLLLGHALADRGDETAAGHEFDSALTTFETFGAERLAERARLALHRVGERQTSGRRSRSRATAVGFSTLTERQTEIISRVVLGMTNRQISKELYLSEKTIEAHLNRLFTKLGVSSRTELAALAAEQAQRLT